MNKLGYAKKSNDASKTFDQITHQSPDMKNFYENSVKRE